MIRVTQGMFARVFLTGDSASKVLIPSSALVSKYDLTGVYAVDRDSVAHLHFVDTGKEYPQGVEITAGLQSGERIVVQGQERLANGVTVEVEP